MNKKFALFPILILSFCIAGFNTQLYINGQQLPQEHEEQHTGEEEAEREPEEDIFEENPEEKTDEKNEDEFLEEIKKDENELRETLEENDMEDDSNIEETAETSIIPEEDLPEEPPYDPLFSGAVLFQTLEPNTALNYEELESLIENAAEFLETYIYIGNHIELENTLEISPNKNIILVDNGGNYEITVNQGNFSGKGMFHVSSGAQFTIKENSGRLTFDGSGIKTTSRSGYFVTCEGTFNLLGGTFQNASLANTYTAAVLVNSSEGKATFNMEGGTIKDGLINKPFSAAILMLGNSIFNMSGGEIINNRHEGSFYDQQIAAGIYMMPYADSEAIFNMSGGTIKGNNGFFGGGVFLYCDTASRYAEFNMTGGTISDNEASYGGGGVFLLGNTSFEMKNGLIAGNKASLGGGIGTLDTKTPVSGKFVMTGGTISNNEAGYGGGIYIASNDVLINKGTIENNYASQQGGGIYIGSPEYTMILNDALITGNYADEGAAIGGGIWLCPTGTLHANITGSMSILGNTASSGGNDVASESKDSPYYTLIPERITGGSRTQWYQDAPGNRHSDTNEEKIDLNTVMGNEYYAAAKYSPEAEKNAHASYNVLITGNHSAKGGGIGTNGGITSGSPEFAEIKIIKQWQAEEGTVIPDEITISLIIDGEIQPEELILSAESGWTASITNLPLLPNTEDYYHIAEIKIDGFDSKIDKTFDKNTNTITVIITNTENDTIPREPKEPEESIKPENPSGPNIEIPEREGPEREHPQREIPNKVIDKLGPPLKEEQEPEQEEPPIFSEPEIEEPFISEPEIKSEELCSQQDTKAEPDFVIETEYPASTPKDNPKTGGTLNISGAFTAILLLSSWILITVYGKNQKYSY